MDEEEVPRRKRKPRQAPRRQIQLEPQTTEPTQSTEPTPSRTSKTSKKQEGTLSRSKKKDNSSSKSKSKDEASSRKRKSTNVNKTSSRKRSKTATVQSRDAAIASQSQVGAETNIANQAATQSENQCSEVGSGGEIASGSASASAAASASGASPANAGRSSPEPNCAICLSKLENKSFTDSCFHTFCFVCLLEWSKVKAECPLCKQKFKSIVHNVRSYDDYDQYHIKRPSERARSFGEMSDGRRFRFRSTMTGDHHYHLQSGELDRLERQIQEQMELDLLQHPPFVRSCGAYFQGRVSAMSHWRRRRQTATTEFRRTIYRNNLKTIEPTGVRLRSREATPAFFNRNPAVTHRLVPWLNRELNAVLFNNDEHVTFVMELIMGLILRFEIESEEFYQHLYPFIGRHTRQFMHEFRLFAQSPYNMAAYDNHVNYEPQTEQIESNSDSDTEANGDEGNDSDVMIVSPSNVPQETIGGSRHKALRVISSDEDSDSQVSGSRNEPQAPQAPRFSDLSPLLSRVRQILGQETSTSASGWDSPTAGPSWMDLMNSSATNWVPPAVQVQTIPPVSDFFAPITTGSVGNTLFLPSIPSFTIPAITVPTDQSASQPQPAAAEPVASERRASVDSSPDSVSSAGSDVMIVDYEKPWLDRSPIMLSSEEDPDISIVSSTKPKKKDKEKKKKKKKKHSADKDKGESRKRRKRHLSDSRSEHSKISSQRTRSRSKSPAEAMLRSRSVSKSGSLRSRSGSSRSNSRSSDTPYRHKKFSRRKKVESERRERPILLDLSKYRTEFRSISRSKSRSRSRSHSGDSEGRSHSHHISYRHRRRTRTRSSSVEIVEYRSSKHKNKKHKKHSKKHKHDKSKKHKRHSSTGHHSLTLFSDGIEVQDVSEVDLARTLAGDPKDDVEILEQPKTNYDSLAGIHTTVSTLNAMSDLPASKNDAALNVRQWLGMEESPPTSKGFKKHPSGHKKSSKKTNMERSKIVSSESQQKTTLSTSGDKNSSTTEVSMPDGRSRPAIRFKISGKKTTEDHHFNVFDKEDEDNDCPLKITFRLDRKATEERTSTDKHSLSDQQHPSSFSGSTHSADIHSMHQNILDQGLSRTEREMQDDSLFNTSPFLPAGLNFHGRTWSQFDDSSDHDSQRTKIYASPSTTSRVSDHSPARISDHSPVVGCGIDEEEELFVQHTTSQSHSGLTMGQDLNQEEVRVISEASKTINQCNSNSSSFELSEVNTAGQGDSGDKQDGGDTQTVQESSNDRQSGKVEEKEEDSEQSQSDVTETQNRTFGVSGLCDIRQSMFEDQPSKEASSADMSNSSRTLFPVQAYYASNRQYSDSNSSGSDAGFDEHGDQNDTGILRQKEMSDTEGNNVNKLAISEQGEDITSHSSNVNESKDERTKDEGEKDQNIENSSACLDGVKSLEESEVSDKEMERTEDLGDDRNIRKENISSCSDEAEDLELTRIVSEIKQNHVMKEKQCVAELSNSPKSCSEEDVPVGSMTHEDFNVEGSVEKALTDDINLCHSLESEKFGVVGKSSKHKKRKKEHRLSSEERHSKHKKHKKDKHHSRESDSKTKHKKHRRHSSGCSTDKDLKGRYKKHKKRREKHRHGHSDNRKSSVVECAKQSDKSAISLERDITNSYTSPPRLHSESDVLEGRPSYISEIPQLSPVQVIENEQFTFRNDENEHDSAPYYLGKSDALTTSYKEHNRMQVNVPVSSGRVKVNVSIPLDKIQHCEKSKAKSEYCDQKEKPCEQGSEEKSQDSYHVASDSDCNSVLDSEKYIHVNLMHSANYEHCTNIEQTCEQDTCTSVSLQYHGSVKNVCSSANTKFTSESSGTKIEEPVPAITSASIDNCTSIPNAENMKSEDIQIRTINMNSSADDGHGNRDLADTAPNSEDITSNVDSPLQLQPFSNESSSDFYSSTEDEQ